MTTSLLVRARLSSFFRGSSEERFLCSLPDFLDLDSRLFFLSLFLEDRVLLCFDFDEWVELPFSIALESVCDSFVLTVSCFAFPTRELRFFDEVVCSDWLLSKRRLENRSSTWGFWGRWSSLKSTFIMAASRCIRSEAVSPDGAFCSTLASALSSGIGESGCNELVWLKIDSEVLRSHVWSQSMWSFSKFKSDELSQGKESSLAQLSSSKSMCPSSENMLLAQLSAADRMEDLKWLEAFLRILPTLETLERLSLWTEPVFSPSKTRWTSSMRTSPCDLSSAKDLRRAEDLFIIRSMQRQKYETGNRASRGLTVRCCSEWHYYYFRVFSDMALWHGRNYSWNNDIIHKSL